MANSERGEVAVEIGGVEYTLVLDTNALVRLEDVFSTSQKDVTFVEILERVNRNSMRHIRALVWAALQRHHPKVTMERAGDLIQEAGGILGLAEKLEGLMRSSTPDKADVAELSVSPNPQKARGDRPAGEHSISKHAVSA